MDAEDREVAETARRTGMGVLRGLLTEDELDAARSDFDRAHVEMEKGPGEPGVRDSIWGEGLLAYPDLARLFGHPRIIGVIGMIVESPVPWLSKMKTNRYTPEHRGVGAHSDTPEGVLVPAFSEVATQVFLDDIREDSGALLYVPGTHVLHFESEEDPDRKAPGKEEIRAGVYLPVELDAGSVVFRVPQVWHAVKPIRRLRRYVTGSYLSRAQLRPPRPEGIERVVARRKQIPVESIPEAVRAYWAC